MLYEITYTRDEEVFSIVAETPDYDSQAVVHPEVVKYAEYFGMGCSAETFTISTYRPVQINMDGVRACAFSSELYEGRVPAMARR